MSHTSPGVAEISGQTSRHGRRSRRPESFFFGLPIVTEHAVLAGRSTLAEKLYEGMFLLDSGRFAEDPEGSTKTLLGLLEKVDGTVVAHRPLVKS